jgi:MFS family permease
VVHALNLLFLIFIIAGAVSSNIPMSVIFRLGQAFSVCGAGTLGPGFIANLTPVEHRGLAMSIFAVGPTLGSSISSVIGGILAEKTGWRWVFWSIAICTGCLILFTIILLQETYGPAILERREARAKKTNGNTIPRRPFSTILAAIIRPIKLLIRSPVTLILALQNSIALGYINLVLSTFALIFQDQYKFTPWQSGFTLFGVGIGFIIGQIAIGLFSDRWLQHRKKRHGNETQPEDRLPPLIIGSLAPHPSGISLVRLDFAIPRSLDFAHHRKCAY